MHKITTTLRILKATPSRNRVLKIESACGGFENQRQNGLGLHERASVTTASPVKVHSRCTAGSETRLHWTLRCSYPWQLGNASVHSRIRVAVIWVSARINKTLANRQAAKLQNHGFRIVQVMNKHRHINASARACRTLHPRRAVWKSLAGLIKLNPKQRCSAGGN